MLSEDMVAKVLEGETVYAWMPEREGEYPAIMVLVPKYQRDSGRVQSIMIRLRQPARGEGEVLPAP